VSAVPGPATAPPVTQQREFWVLMGYAVALGVFGGFAGVRYFLAEREQVRTPGEHEGGERPPGSYPATDQR